MIRTTSGGALNLAFGQTMSLCFLSLCVGAKTASKAHVVAHHLLLLIDSMALQRA